MHPHSLLELAPSWIERAKTSTKANRIAGKYVDDGPSWSEIKPDYLHVQGKKCAYCEKSLTLEDLGATDMEHYRPKKSVKAWPTQTIRDERNIDYDVPSRSSKIGYYLLTHNLWNYVASCKKCNSMKSDFFPTMGTLDLKNDDPTKSNSEQPYLLYPIGELDPDPEELFTFIGVSPVLVSDDDDKKMRARVTIDFFDLANRPTLIEQRAEVIDQLWNALEVKKSRKTQASIKLAQNSIDKKIATTSKHANCARAFYRLYHENEVQAEEIYILANMIYTKSEGLPETV